jgi:hypothetical protein
MNQAKITQTRGTFSLACDVEININAKPESIWSILTDSKNFPSWNSNVRSIEGQIHEGERLQMHVPGTDRAFTPKVSGVVPNRRMIWSDGFSPLFNGVRIFELSPCKDGSTDFAMGERFSGLLLPLFKGSMPDFGPVFEGWANDLKHEAEQANHT